jgi:hypothetical protein
MGMKSGSLLLRIGVRHARSRSRLGALLATCAALGSAMTSGPAHAGEPMPPQSSSIYLLPARAARLPAESQNANAVLAAPAERSADNQVRQPAPAYGSSTTRAALIEMPADVIPGRYTRPKYALGFHSDAMKGFAKDLGLEADTCLLPLVRARLSLSQEDGTNGRVMVFARCTFH